MAITEERFQGDGVTKIFTPASYILSQNHIRVDYCLTSDLENIMYIPPDEWDLVNNSVLFKTAPTIDMIVILSISTTGEDLEAPLSAVQIVADIKDEVVNTSNIKDDILTCSSNSNNISTVSDNIDKVGVTGDNIQPIITTSDNIDSVKTVSNNIANITSVSNDIININIVAEDKLNVDIVSESIDNVNSVADNKTNIDTVADNIDNIDITAQSIDDVNTYAKTYQGAYDTEPENRNNGSVLQAGDLFFDTVNKVMKAYDGSSWQITQQYSDEDILNKLKNVDGSGSGLDADTVDGLQANQFIRTDIDTVVNADITFSQDIQGVIITDRSDTTKKYRLFIEDGNLGIEEV